MNFNDFFNELKSQFEIVKYLSDKPNSKVLLLKHKKLGKKMIFRKYRNSQEAYIFLKSISFINFPKIYDTRELDDCFIVFEEYIDGITVAEVLESGLYTYIGAKKVISSVCDALKILHNNGFIHRDIKPQNIIISNDGTVKLIDFNISRKYKSEANNDTATLGTIGYASPEQIGISQTSAATDIYAIGVLLNVMLTGKHPSEYLCKGKARKIILRCTQISPEKRFENVEKLKNML